MKKVVSSKSESVQIPKLILKTVRLTIEGSSPLLVNQFSEKSRRQILENQMQKAKNKKEARDPQAEYEASLYRIPGKKLYGFPAAGLKKALVSACGLVDGISKSQANGAFRVGGDIGGLIVIDGKPVMDQRIVRVGPWSNRQPMERFRGRFDQWKASFTITYDTSLLNSEQLAHLVQRAGFSIGLCEFRPQKGGDCGTFNLVS